MLVKIAIANMFLNSCSNILRLANIIQNEVVFILDIIMIHTVYQI